MLNLDDDISLLICPGCIGELGISSGGENLRCAECKEEYPVVDKVPYFCPVSEAINPSAADIDVTDAAKWTQWRRLNFEYCERALAHVSADSTILDIAAGRGHFRRLFEHFNKYVAVDFYPYNDISVIANFTERLPFADDIADVIVLSNVLEHTPEPEFLLRECHRLLEPTAKLIILVPFLIKVHQAPYDFYRYTNFAIDYLMKKAGFQECEIKGLGGLLDVFELLQFSTIRTAQDQNANTLRKIEAKIVRRLAKFTTARLKGFSMQGTDEYVQGYGCVATKQ